MTFWDQGTPREPYGYIKTKKFKIDNIHCERGFLYILKQSWPIVLRCTFCSQTVHYPDKKWNIEKSLTYKNNAFPSKLAKYQVKICIKIYYKLMEGIWYGNWPISEGANFVKI